MFSIDALNILFITGSFPHLSQVFIQWQIIKCIQRGHNVYIHAFKRPKHPKIQKEIMAYNLLEKVTYGDTFPQLSSFDVIYAQFGFHGTRVVEQAYIQKSKKPIVVCFRGNDLSGHIQKDAHCYDELFKKVDLFLPVCSFFKNRLIALGCDESKIIVHHSAINIDDFEFKNHIISETERLNLISVCRLTEKKGLEYAILAVAQLKKKYPFVKYVIIGDADYHAPLYKKRIQDLVVRLGLGENVYFYGWATHEEIIPLLEKADIFLLPSITASRGDQEGIANALKEAMAGGLPVIATDHAGTSELVEHGRTGLLVPEKDYMALVKAVYWYIKHPEKIKKITKKARIKIEQEFSIDSTVEKLEHIFEELIKQKALKYVEK
jgi:colanic acid/amylovoran biosynthesis glycosyltransferase